MKLYLSSFRVGDDTEGLKKLIGKAGARVAVIVNALDSDDDLERKGSSLEYELESMRSLGFSPEHVDLREYFNTPGRLATDLAHFDALWVRGGNTFILRKAMEKSGFKEVIDKLIRTNKLVYAGYSAGIAVLAPSLRGVELVDDPDAEADGYDPDIIWEGYGLIDFYPIVHYDSDHPESHLVDKELAHITSLGIKYRALRDGDTIIIDTPE